VGQPAGGHAAGILSGLKLWVIDAYGGPGGGHGRRINTIMQTCFFAISGILPHDEAIAAIKKASTRPTARRASAWPTSTTAPST
jgi:pyruvate-ferredoxin/flavodoxin oxidoreductase